MILTKDKNRVVYIGRYNGAITYIGRGHLNRPISLLEQKGHHHIEGDFDEVEIIGPFSYEESKLKEKEMIEEFLPALNTQIRKTFVAKMARMMEVKLRKEERLLRKEESLLKREAERAGYEERRKSRNETKTAILARIEEGSTLSDIARDFSVSRQYIHKLKKMVDSSA